MLYPTSDFGFRPIDQARAHKKSDKLSILWRSDIRYYGSPTVGSGTVIAVALTERVSTSLAL